MGTNTRNIAKLTPEVLAQIKKLTGVTAKLEDAGKILMSPGGEKTLASMGETALTTATSAAVNSKTKTLMGTALKKWAIKSLIGGGGALSLGTLYRYTTNQKAAQNDLTAHLKESAITQDVLRDLGDPESVTLADTIQQADETLETDLAKWTSAIPIFGSGNIKIQAAERQVNAANLAAKNKKELAEKTAVQTQLDKEAAK